MIELQNVTYSYPESETPVVHNLSLKVREGEFLLVVGASGCGKSTLLRCLNGLVPHFHGGVLRGRIAVAGRDPVAEGPRGMSSVVGFVIQDPEGQFVVDSVEEELAFAMENHNVEQAIMRKRIEEVLDQLSITHLRQRRVHTLSGGEKQRVAIASVLTLQPKVLVLDEPTSQLDPQAAEEVLTILQKLNADLGLTIVLAEHRLERVVQYADRMIYLPGEGETPIVGTPEEVLTRIDLVPPLVQVARKLKWQPLPLTIKAGRRFVPGVELQAPGPRPGTSRSMRQDGTPPVVRVSDLWFSYNGCEALRGVDLAIRPGEFVALMGRNGSGKTTLLRHLVGLLRPGRGMVELWGEDTSHRPTEDIAQRVGYVPQNPGALLFADTLQQELQYTLRSHGLREAKPELLLRSLSLEQYANDYPGDLSSGERQRAALAAILIAEPELILLDEPTRGLDYRQKEILAGFLSKQREEGKTILISTHDVELAARCADRVVILGEGQVVVDGPTRTVMSESMVFSTQINKLFRDNRFLTADDVLEAVAT
jgi:energy-coupling factor transporter ATP-binding protein EcfA2